MQTRLNLSRLINQTSQLLNRFSFNTMKVQLFLKNKTKNLDNQKFNKSKTQKKIGNRQKTPLKRNE